MSYYYGTGVERDLARALSLFEQAATQQEPSALFMLGMHYQRLNPALSEQYFERAKSTVWSSHSSNEPPLVASLEVSDHFAKWHYLNFHHRITDGFNDAGRQPSSASREVILIVESDPDLQRCVSEAQKLVAHVSGAALLM